MGGTSRLGRAGREVGGDELATRWADEEWVGTRRRGREGQGEREGGRGEGRSERASANTKISLLHRIENTIQGWETGMIRFAPPPLRRFGFSDASQSVVVCQLGGVTPGWA